jgi:hypothetical protein
MDMLRKTDFFDVALPATEAFLRPYGTRFLWAFP